MISAHRDAEKTTGTENHGDGPLGFFVLRGELPGPAAWFSFLWCWRKKHRKYNT